MHIQETYPELPSGVLLIQHGVEQRKLFAEVLSGLLERQVMGCGHKYEALSFLKINTFAAIIIVPSHIFPLTILPKWQFSEFAPTFVILDDSKALMHDDLKLAEEFIVNGYRWVNSNEVDYLRGMVTNASERFCHDNKPIEIMDGLILNRLGRKLIFNDKEIGLTRSQFRFFSQLACCPGQCIDTSDPNFRNNNEALVTLIKKTRRELDKVIGPSWGAKIIETIPGACYRIAPREELDAILREEMPLRKSSRPINHVTLQPTPRAPLRSAFS